MKYVHGFVRLWFGLVLSLFFLFWFCFIIVPYGFVQLFSPYPSGLLHWHWGNHMIAPVPVKKPWRIWMKSTIVKPQQITTGLNMLTFDTMMLPGPLVPLVSIMTCYCPLLIPHDTDKTAYFWIGIFSVSCLWLSYVLIFIDVRTELFIYSYICLFLVIVC